MGKHEDGARHEDSAKHEVTIEFYGFGEKFWADGRRPLDALFALQEELLAALEGKGLGELDSNEIALDGSDGSIYFLCPDADALFAAIEPVLKSSPVTQGGNATLRYGSYDEPNVMEKYIEITPHLH
jgi:hypothetical protein